MFNSEIKKSLKSIIQFNKQFVLENNYINLRNSIFTKDIEKHNILIDSMTTNPDNTNNYTILFDDNNIPVLKNMIGIRLVETSIMVPPNNVHNNNNKIRFKYGSVDKDVTLNIGNYDNDELASELQQRINLEVLGEEIPDPDFTITFNKDVNDNKFTIERVVGTQNIQIDWTYYSNNAWRLFGFENKDTCK